VNLDNPRELRVPKELDGSRVDKAALALVAVGSPMSRAQMKRAIAEGAVRVNGRRRAKGATVAEGDVITIGDGVVTTAVGPALPEPDAELRVVFESSGVVVVDKPAGQPSAPIERGEKGTLANALVGHYPEMAAVGYSLREPGLLHRLDTDTSGLVVAARSTEAFERLKAGLKQDRLKKSYLLVCREEALADHGTIEIPIASHPKDHRRVYACVHPRDVARYAPKPATTRFSVLERGPRWALVHVDVARALRHQIRVHFAAIDRPLAGDILYGGEEVPLGHHALHAERIAFEDDELGFDVTAPLPEGVRALIHAP
jgi:23S rRNA pseudouridine1911/1915/1917 synthase